MTAPAPWDDCIAVSDRPELPGGRPIRVAEILATGTSGGAQEHLYSLLSGLDRDRYAPEVIALSDGAAARRIRRLGVPVTVIDIADDTEAVRELTEHLAANPPDVVHNHMYRAEIIGTRAALALSEQGHPRPYVVSTVHSSRIRSDVDRDLLRALTKHMDRLVAVSQAIVAKLRREGRDVIPVDLVYNGVDLHRYDEQEACCTLPEEYGFAPGSPIVGVVGRLEPEKGHDT
ncbi:MAG: glycosyltransferase, partial [Candidatus Limnocylindrales bacterium]